MLPKKLTAWLRLYSLTNSGLSFNRFSLSTDAHRGKPRVSNRQALSSILFVLMTGVPWRPTSLGFGSGPTCWRRLKVWHEAGVWQQLHYELLQRLHLAGRIEWERACVDG